jgi:Arsenical resistance operon protein ArsD
MVTVEVFDPAMCCSTGVCGPSVDPALVRFAADLEWLTGQGVSVARATLSQQPDRFVATEPIRAALVEQGDRALPAVLVDGVLRTTGRYPGREELATWAGLAGAGGDQPAVGAMPVGATVLSQAGGCCGGGSC